MEQFLHVFVSSRTFDVRLPGLLKRERNKIEKLIPGWRVTTCSVLDVSGQMFRVLFLLRCALPQRGIPDREILAAALQSPLEE